MQSRPTLPHHYGGTTFSRPQSTFGTSPFPAAPKQSRVTVQNAKSGISPFAKALWEGVTPKGHPSIKTPPSFQRRERQTRDLSLSEREVYPFRAQLRGAHPRRALEGDADESDDGDAPESSACVRPKIPQIDFSAFSKKLRARFSDTGVHTDDLLLFALFVTLAKEKSDKILLCYLALLFFAGW